MSTTCEVLPRKELELRWARCRKMLRQYVPRAEGVLIFSRVSLYYFTGHLANGLFWLPLEGEPVLLCRKGSERAAMESAVSSIEEFRSYKELTQKLSGAGSALGDVVAVPMNDLPWGLGLRLEQALGKKVQLIAGDIALQMTRAWKTPWERRHMQTCGRLHHEGLFTLLPEKIHTKMTEREISLVAWEVFFAQGHSGPLRMGHFGEEAFLGHVAAGNTANYPSVFNGPVGLRGEHPAVPFMGSRHVVWEKNMPLTCDIGFCLDGYTTDKTQVYWSGRPSDIPAAVQRAHDFCIDVQNQAASAMRPGACIQDIYHDALSFAHRQGLSEGFMGLGKNKVPFLGHSIGLVIDEFPPVADKVELELEEGMIFALEPKIGIADVGMVGVENTFEVKGDGAHSITGQDCSIICIAD